MTRTLSLFWKVVSVPNYGTPQGCSAIIHVASSWQGIMCGSNKAIRQPWLMAVLCTGLPGQRRTATNTHCQRAALPLGGGWALAGTCEPSYWNAAGTAPRLRRQQCSSRRLKRRWLFAGPRAGKRRWLGACWYSGTCEPSYWDAAGTAPRLRRRQCSVRRLQGDGYWRAPCRKRRSLGVCGYLTPGNQAM